MLVGCNAVALWPLLALFSYIDSGTRNQTGKTSKYHVPGTRLS